MIITPNGGHLFLTLTLDFSGSGYDANTFDQIWDNLCDLVGVDLIDDDGLPLGYIEDLDFGVGDFDAEFQINYEFDHTAGELANYETRVRKALIDAVTEVLQA